MKKMMTMERLFLKMLKLSQNVFLGYEKEYGFEIEDRTRKE